MKAPCILISRVSPEIAPSEVNKVTGHLTSTLGCSLLSFPSISYPILGGGINLSPRTAPLEAFLRLRQPYLANSLYHLYHRAMQNFYQRLDQDESAVPRRPVDYWLEQEGFSESYCDDKVL